jgi:hypothetical protein
MSAEMQPKYSCEMSFLLSQPNRNWNISPWRALYIPLSDMKFLILLCVFRSTEKSSHLPLPFIFQPCDIEIRMTIVQSILISYYI